MFRSGDTARIAVDHDNAPLMKSFHLCHPDLFIYREGIQMTWKSYVKREEAGNLRLRKVGRPYAEWLIPYMTLKSYRAFKDEFCPGEDALVTIRTLHGITNEFVNCNAKLVWPEEVERDALDYRGIKLLFNDIVIL